MLRYISLFEKTLKSEDIVKLYPTATLQITKSEDHIEINLFDSETIITNSKINLDGIFANARLEFWSENPYECYSVSNSAAVKGFGVWLYDTMLSLAGTKGLCPDRFDVTSAAQSVWEFYYNNRSSEIITKPIDDFQNPITSEMEDDSEVHYPDPLATDFSTRHPVDYVYYFKNPKKYFKNSLLLERWKSFQEELPSFGYTKKSFLTDLKKQRVPFLIKQKQIRGL